jgi:hypothetical protein
MDLGRRKEREHWRILIVPKRTPLRIPKRISPQRETEQPIPIELPQREKVRIER